MRVIGLLAMGLLGAALLASCQMPPTQQEIWQHTDRQEQLQQEQAGVAGNFACHTADGGCLHMACSSKSGCELMQQARKDCAIPKIDNTDLIVSDGDCKSETTDEIPPPVPDAASTAVVSGTGYTIYPNSCPVGSHPVQGLGSYVCVSN